MKSRMKMWTDPFVVSDASTEQMPLDNNIVCQYGVWVFGIIVRGVLWGSSPLMSSIFSPSLSCDAAHNEGQPSADSEEYRTQWSADQAVQDPHQPPQASSCMSTVSHSLLTKLYV